MSSYELVDMNSVRMQIKELSAEIERLRTAMQWRPIEEAPKDGTQFLALLSNDWYALLRAPTGLKEGWPFQWWNGSQNPPIVETHPANTDWNKTHTILATHWMPLPPPPAGEPGHE